MNKQIFRSSLLNEEVVCYTMDNGLRLYVLSKSEFSTRFALFGTRFGSIDTDFSINAEEMRHVPAGIAHFLEHKMFENEEADAFERYNKTGASANAYTSFDRTCYLFQCSDRFYESYDILLDFVQSPYFTPQTVQKEQGIIGQEIGMYDDDGEWQVFMNALRALYRVHPVNIDIAGTKESIAKITADDLYACHTAFYHPSNMFICVVGNEDPDTIAEFTRQRIRDRAQVTVCKKEYEEPREIAQREIVATSEVSHPLFTLAYKERCDAAVVDLKERLCFALLLDILCSSRSPLYKKMVDQKLINATFSTSVFYGRGYFAAMFGGESNDPYAVQREIETEIERLRKEGVSSDAFEASRRQLYAARIRRFDSAEEAADCLVSAALNGEDPYAALEFYRTVTLQDVQQILAKTLDNRYCAMSIVNPMRQEELECK